MAAAPMPNPQASAPQPGNGDGAGASPQANPLQATLGKLAMLTKSLGAQNASIQEEMDAAVASFVKAIQKTQQGASGPPQQAPAPQQQ
jgi:hypothetical protein